MSGARDVEVRWVASADDIPRDLWARCFPPPLEGLWWYSTLEKSELESQFQFSYAVVERRGTPIGIAPVFRMDVPLEIVAPPLVARVLRVAGGRFPSFRYQRTLFVGSPCSDEGTVGLLEGERLSEVAPVIQQALQGRARAERVAMTVWKDFPEESPNDLEVLRALGLFKVVSYPGTRVSLPRGGFDGYLASLKGTKRHNVRKKIRRGKEATALETSIVQRPDRAVLDEVFRLFWATYEHGKTKFERLTPEFFRRIAAAEAAHFILLRDPGTRSLAAFMLCFTGQKRVINKFIGFDYARARDQYLYFQLWEQAVSWAAGRGATEIQSGQTGYRAKLDVGHELVPLFNFCRHTNRLLHLVFARVAKGIRWGTLDADLE